MTRRSHRGAFFVSGIIPGHVVHRGIAEHEKGAGHSMHIGLYSWAGCLIDDVAWTAPIRTAGGTRPSGTPRGIARCSTGRSWRISVGYESFWLTEHHFQREGYQIIPNVVLVSTTLAQHTRRIKFGAFFHQTPIWNPIRLAEDLAIADIMTGGRMLFGTGRGSVQREMPIFGATFGRGGDSDDRANRDLFEEQMAILKLAWSSPSSTTRATATRSRARLPEHRQPGHGPAVGQGDAGAAPGPPDPDLSGGDQRADVPLRGERGARRDLPAGQPDAVRAEAGSGSASWSSSTRGAGGRSDRMVVVQVHLGETREQAFERFRPAHDERNRFLGAQRPIGGYLDEEGKPFGFGRLPTLEESVGQSWLVRRDAGAGPRRAARGDHDLRDRADGRRDRVRRDVEGADRGADRGVRDGVRPALERAASGTVSVG